MPSTQTRRVYPDAAAARLCWPPTTDNLGMLRYTVVALSTTATGLFRAPD